MVRFEIRYRMPHGVGSRIVRHNDRYDAEAEGQERYGDAFIEAVEYAPPKQGDLPPASASHDMLVHNRPKPHEKGVMPGHVRPPGV